MQESALIKKQPDITPAAITTRVFLLELSNRDTYADELNRLPVQKKVFIGSVDDSLEDEADAMADKVMRMPEPNFIQRKCAHCEEEERVQRKPLVSFIQKKEAGNNNIESDAISSQIQSTKGSGSTLSGTTKNFMESRFSADFSDVNIHTGNYASQLSNQLNAQAFTIGKDIYFNEGKYDPQNNAGKHLLAHELTHTMQQNNFNARSIQRCAKPADEPVFEALAKTIRANAVYKSLDPDHLRLTEEIITTAKTKADCLFFMNKLDLLFKTQTRVKADISKDATVAGDAAVVAATTRLSNPKEKEQSVLEEQKSFRHRKQLKPAEGFGKTHYYIDNSDPNNIVVKVKVHLTGDKAQVDKVKSLEDDIEKASNTKGYTVDLVFVEYDNKDDVFTVTTDPGGWTDAGNFRASDPHGLAHELHHLLGLPDRYDYILHAGNQDMLLYDRIYWFRQGMDVDPKNIDPNSIMGNPFMPPTDQDVCEVAHLDPAKCKAARNKPVK